MANKIAKFIKEVRLELGKVSWSSRQELISSTAVVIVSVALLAVFIGVCDLVFSRIIDLVMRYL